MWYSNISNYSEVVVSTRVRLARNFSKYNFTNIISKKDSKNVIGLVEDLVKSTSYKFFNMNDIDNITKKSLVEEHLISKEFELDYGEKIEKAVVTNNDSTLVVMINEEDHMRIQSFSSGLNIEDCYKKAQVFSDIIEKNEKLAYNKDYGYLTACPTNVGSAMRVSVMLHLPALARLGILTKLLEDVSSLGITVRGLYGENTKAYANMYQISNQKTLGETDEEIIYRVKNIVLSIIEHEKKARKVLLENSIKLEDEMYRVYGVLKSARMISSEEALDLLSRLRLAAAMKIIPNLKLENVQKLLVLVQPYSFKKIVKEELSSVEELIKRAEYIRKEID